MRQSWRECPRNTRASLEQTRAALRAREDDLLARATAVHVELGVIERYLSLDVNAPPLPTDQWNQHSVSLRADTTHSMLWATVAEAYDAVNLFNHGAANKGSVWSTSQAARKALLEAFPPLGAQP